MYLKNYDIHVPCGRCRACRISRSREWAVRMIHETDFYEDTVFLTLTYNDEHLPRNNGLEKRELQNYFKRLRKSLKDLKIKYYASGEYGEKNGRPHYHAIIYGLSLKDHEIQYRQGSYSCTGGKLYDAWHPRGFVTLGNVTYDSARYVADYIQKKQFALNAIGKPEQPFNLMSKGIGERYVKANEKQLRDNISITLRGVKMTIPKYYKKKLDQIHGFDANYKKNKLKADMEESLREMQNAATEHYLKKYDHKGPEAVWEASKASRRQKERNLEARQTLKNKGVH